jgi:glutamine synthetase
MLREGLIFVGTCDIAGHVRGKGSPASELHVRRKTGIGWTHSNLMQTAFGPILDTPFGTGGDPTIVPDPSAEVDVDFGDGSAPEHFFLGDIRNTDGTPWERCPREFLRRAIAALDEASGLHLIAAFEQEFVYTGNEDRPGDAYSLSAWRRQGIFGQSFIAAIRAAGAEPDSFLPEYGPFAASKKKDIAKAFNLEFRVSDGSASPYMALGALIFGGADGIARKLALPEPGTEAQPLPRSLGQALDNMEKSAAMQTWFSPTFL